MELQQLNVKDTVFDVDIVRTNNRNAYARVLNGRIVISVPERLNNRKMEEIANGLYARIKKSIERNPEYYTQKDDYLNFKNGEIITALGKNFRIAVFDCTANTGSAVLENNEIRIFAPAHLDAERKRELTSYFVRKMLTKSLKSEIVDRAKTINSMYFNSNISSIKITNASSRWGSCSRRRSSEASSIALNFKLVFMPMQCLDYVIVHELAHTKELNHSKEFWRLVANVMPDYKEKRRMLKNSRPSLNDRAY